MMWFKFILRLCNILKLCNQKLQHHCFTDLTRSYLPAIRKVAPQHIYCSQHLSCAAGLSWCRAVVQQWCCSDAFQWPCSSLLCDFPAFAFLWASRATELAFLGNQLLSSCLLSLYMLYLNLRIKFLPVSSCMQHFVIYSSFLRHSCHPDSVIPQLQLAKLTYCNWTKVIYDVTSWYR